MEAAILKGVASFKSSYTFFIASPPYTAPNEESTSSFRSFESDSSNNERSGISASREWRDVDFSLDEGVPNYAMTFPFPSNQLHHLEEATSHDLPLSLSLPEDVEEDHAAQEMHWCSKLPPLAEE